MEIFKKHLCAWSAPAVQVYRKTPIAFKNTSAQGDILVQFMTA